MKKEVKLNDAQLEALAPYEKYFGTAIRSGYAQHPGTAAIETMRTVWAELTGQRYPMNLGCTRCLMNLLKDIGTLYFAAKGIDPYTAAQRIVKVYPTMSDNFKKLAKEAAKPSPSAEAAIDAGIAAEKAAENGGTADGGTTAPAKEEKPKTGTKKGKNAKK